MIDSKSEILIRLSPLDDITDILFFSIIEFPNVPLEVAVGLAFTITFKLAIGDEPLLFDVVNLIVFEPVVAYTTYTFCPLAELGLLFKNCQLNVVDY